LICQEKKERDELGSTGRAEIMVGVAAALRGNGDAATCMGVVFETFMVGVILGRRITRDGTLVGSAKWGCGVKDIDCAKGSTTEGELTPTVLAGLASFRTRGAPAGLASGTSLPDDLTFCTTGAVAECGDAATAVKNSSGHHVPPRAWTESHMTQNQ
jgi:hypothetical protein